MNPDAINRACAELCGWKLAPWSKDDRGRPMEPVEMWFAPGETIPHEMFPLHRFTTSLDAAQMAFKTLTEEQRLAAHLALPDELEWFILATPLQWCEAILRAAGKWKESQ